MASPTTACTRRTRSSTSATSTTASAPGCGCSTASEPSSLAEADNLERELKFGCADLDALRSRLAELGAERVRPAALEDNRVFDRGDELAKRGCLLRVRVDGQGTRLTFKGPAHMEGGVKVRPEHEVTVADAGGLDAILGALGYRQVRRYQKRREEWRLGGVIVALDQTPIGSFAEFEGDSAERVADRCGLAAGDAEARTYLALYDEYRRGNPDAPRDMVFA